MLAVLLVATAVTVVVLRSGKSQVPQPSLALAFTEATPNPSMVTTIVSPDSKATLTMREKNTNGEKELTFSVKKDGVEKEVFSKILSAGSVVSIPYNTFSPDDKYIFLKEVVQDNATYLVFATSGFPIAEDAQYFEIVGKFAEKEPDFKITDVTGWGGSTLIIINTDKNEGGIGPSFWFDVPSQSFIRLTNRFN